MAETGKRYNVYYNGERILQEEVMTAIPYYIVEHYMNINKDNITFEQFKDKFREINEILPDSQPLILNESEIGGEKDTSGKRKTNYIRKGRELLEYNHNGIKTNFGVSTQWANDNSNSNFAKFIIKIKEFGYDIELINQESNKQNKNMEIEAKDIKDIIKLIIKEQNIKAQDFGIESQDIDKDWFDMALIKDLPESCVGRKNEMNSHQSSIIIGNKNFGMFPVIKRSEFAEKTVGRHITVKLPIKLMSNNIRYLKEEKIENENRVIESFVTTNEASANRLEFGTKKIDGKDYVDFYNSLYSNCKIIILKIKGKCEYIVLGIRQEDCEKYLKCIDFQKQNEFNYFDFKNKINSPEQVTYLSKDNFIGYGGINENCEDGDRITGGKNILLYGVPGAGKSHKIKEEYCSDENYIQRVVFHPDYTYSDFVGQILPRVDKDDKLKYVFVPGPFTKILKKAYKDKEHKYYLIIEELNRGNAPAIFGEIFQLLDRIDEADEKHDESVIGESEYGISNYDIAKEVYDGDADHMVKIPSNMYILATMNTADQNVFTLDTAFQRRWEMKQIPNKMEKDQADIKIEKTNITWGDFVEVINPLIVNINSEMSSSEDKRLGAYFVKKNQFTPQKFSEKVLKYLWDDAFKFNRESVFNDKYKSLEDLITDYEDDSDEDRLKIVLKHDIYNQMISKSENKNIDNI